MTNMTTNNAAPHFPEQVTGMYILAESLKRLGLDTVYGLVGIPVTEVAYAIQKLGMKFVGFRFEQQAGMAAARRATHRIVSGIPQRPYSHGQRYCQLLSHDTDFRGQRHPHGRYGHGYLRTARPA